MANQASKTEILFLKIFKLVVLVVMGLSLITTVGALGFATYQYIQSPKEPAPAEKAPASSVNVEEFMKSLEPSKKTEETKDENMETEPKKKTPTIKYKSEVTQVYGCYVDSSKKSGHNDVVADSDSIERIRVILQRIADSEDYDRGQAYVTDMVKVTCEILLHPKVIQHISKKNDRDIFFNALNFHLKAWDKIKNDAKDFEEKEHQRVQNEINKEEARIENAKQKALMLLMIAGGAFGIFMALALYLIISAMESNLRRISESLEKMNPAS